LVRVLASTPDLAPLRAALSARRWNDAQRLVSRHLAESPRRFVIAPADKAARARRIAAECAGSTDHAVMRADRIRAGQYDLLGYRGLRFGGASPDWHFDPVANARAPETFWADVHYLDPANGDHKVIWELNRHQHW